MYRVKRGGNDAIPVSTPLIRTTFPGDNEPFYVGWDGTSLSGSQGTGYFDLTLRSPAIQCGSLERASKLARHVPTIWAHASPGPARVSSGTRAWGSTKNSEKCDGESTCKCDDESVIQQLGINNPEEAHLNTDMMLGTGSRTQAPFILKLFPTPFAAMRCTNTPTGYPRTKNPIAEQKKKKKNNTEIQIQHPDKPNLTR